jgi:hypothetical protein
MSLLNLYNDDKVTSLTCLYASASQPKNIGQIKISERKDSYGFADVAENDEMCEDSFDQKIKKIFGIHPNRNSAKGQIHTSGAQEFHKTETFNQNNIGYLQCEDLLSINDVGLQGEPSVNENICGQLKFEIIPSFDYLDDCELISSHSNGDMLSGYEYELTDSVELNRIHDEKVPNDNSLEKHSVTYSHDFSALTANIDEGLMESSTGLVSSKPKSQVAEFGSGAIDSNHGTTSRKEFSSEMVRLKASIKEEQKNKPTGDLKKKRVSKKQRKILENLSRNMTTDDHISLSCHDSKDMPISTKARLVLNRKRTRKTGKEESVDLSKRRDVVNKAILRSLRRFLTNKFKESVHDQLESKEHRTKWYYQAIENFTKENYEENEPMMKQLSYYLACIIFPKTLIQSNLPNLEKTEEDINEYYKCIYKYSHTRLLQLLKLDPIRIIYEKFYQEAVENESKHEPISEMKDCAKKAYDEFHEVFMGSNNPESLITM